MDSNKQRYYELETQYKRQHSQQLFVEARETLKALTNLFKAHPEAFDEVDDQARIIETRKLLLEYEKERLSGGNRLATLLRQAASTSVPSVCIGPPCGGDNPKMCTLPAMTLSPRQTKMCIVRFTTLCNALKLEATCPVRTFDYQQALEKRRLAVDTHQTLLQRYYSDKAAENQRYLEYWQSVTEGYVALMSGQSQSAKEWFRKALGLGKLLNQRRCFPNYFRDLKEIEMHDFYIDAIDAFRTASFGSSKALFQKWLEINPERKGKGDLRYDNIYFFQMVCGVLETLTAGQTVEKSKWVEMEDFLDSAYISRPSWVLWARLGLIRELSFRLRTSKQSSLLDALSEEINNTAQEWGLLMPDIQLLGEDRLEGLRRPVILPSFLDLFERLDPKIHDWKKILVQNLKHLLLLIADYEYRRALYSATTENRHPGDGYLVVPSEKMTLNDLTQTILHYLELRSLSHKHVFEGGLVPLRRFLDAIDIDNYHLAVSAQRDVFAALRSWPLVIRIEDQKELPKPLFMDEDNPSFLARETRTVRLWNSKPDSLTIEGPQDLSIGDCYYLRPRWYVRSHERYRIRHEIFLESKVPRQMLAYYESLLGTRKIDSKRFHDWIMQFEDSERLMACQLLDMMRYYDQEDTRNMWLRLYREELPPEAKTKNVAFIAVGHSAKSGALNNYYFRQAMTHLSENERSFEFKNAFREIGDFGALQYPDTVTFVDDFIGTGEQAIKTITHVLKEHHWLANVTCYLCALVGFKDGIDQVKGSLTGKIQKVFVSQLLEERDRAFSEANPSWESNQFRTEVKDWASLIGKQVLEGRSDYDPERDMLGWRDSQALVIFHYNVPNNTLPLFWGNGQRNGRPWIPLQDRFD